MKLTKKALLTTAAVLAFSGMASASPVYYTFTGTVHRTSGNTGSLSYGSEVSYTFVADEDMEGSYTEVGGVIHTIPLGSVTSIQSYPWYFDADNYGTEIHNTVSKNSYTAYISGTLLPDNGYFNNNQRAHASYNVAFTEYLNYLGYGISGGYPYSYGISSFWKSLTGGSQGSRIIVHKEGYSEVTGTYNDFASLDWKLGDIAYGDNSGYDSNGSSRVESTLILSSIIGDTTSVPVPEPSSLLLFSSGISAAVVFRRKLAGVFKRA